jgi:hypothetical protein
MHKLAAFSLALILPLALSPVTVDIAVAGGTDVLAKANCVKAIAESAAQVSRSDVAKFQFSKTGDGFELFGLDENHRQVSCKTAADGHVTWIDGG